MAATDTMLSTNAETILLHTIKGDWFVAVKGCEKLEKRITP